MKTQEADIGSDEGVRPIDVDSTAIALITRGEIDMQISTAHKYPRSIKRFRDEAANMVTLEEAIATECIYCLPRRQFDKESGQWVVTNIEGPSARFAEVIGSAWGNARVGARIVNDANGFITAQGIFHDLERNWAVGFEVQRGITTSKGERFKPDMIAVTGNAASSIALRNAILKGVPKAFWSGIYQLARQTAMGDFKTLSNRRVETLKAFQLFGVSPAMIYAKLMVAGIEEIGLEHLLALKGLLTALRDGDTTPEQAFAPEEGEAIKPGATATMPKAKSEKATDAQKPPPADKATPAGGGTQAGQMLDKIMDDAGSVAASVLGAGHPITKALKETAAGPAAPAESEAVHNVKDKAREDIKTPFDDMRSDAQFEDGRSEPPLFEGDGHVAVGLPLPEKAVAGQFMATAAEVKNIVLRARAKKVNLLELLRTLADPTGVKIVGEGEAQTIEGLSKENMKLLRAQLS